MCMGTKDCGAFQFVLLSARVGTNVMVQPSANFTAME